MGGRSNKSERNVLNVLYDNSTSSLAVSMINEYLSGRGVKYGENKIRCLITKMEDKKWVKSRPTKSSKEKLYSIDKKGFKIIEKARSKTQPRLYSESAS